MMTRIFAWRGETVGPMQMRIQGEGESGQTKKGLRGKFPLSP